MNAERRERKEKSRDQINWTVYNILWIKPFLLFIANLLLSASYNIANDKEKQIKKKLKEDQRGRDSGWKMKQEKNY